MIECDPTGSSTPVPYFCTVGSGGALRLAREEFRRLLGSGHEHEPVEFQDGKCYFSTSLPLEAIAELRSVERVFVSLVRKSVHAGEELPSTQKALLRQISEAVIHCPKWKSSLSKWRRFRGTQPEIKGQNVDFSGCTQNMDPSITFKVKCHRSGSRTSHVRSSDIAAHVGGELSDHFGWTVDLKSAELEIVIFICDNSWLAGIPVLRQAQSDRGYIKHTGLHPTVSWALARIGGIQPNDLVCDPMCGKGITLLEASMKWPAGNYLGLDIDTTQLELAQDNITKAGVSAKVCLLHGDCTAMPLINGCIDVILCDMPFGKQYGSVEENILLYPQMLQEAARVVRPGGRAVLLTNCENEALMKEQVEPDGVQQQIGNWQFVAKYPFTLGYKMPTIIYFLRRVGQEDQLTDESGSSRRATDGGWQNIATSKGRLLWRKKWMKERAKMVSI